MPSRNIDDLCPAVADRCRRFIDECKRKGIPVIVTSTIRTEAEQCAYYMQGRKDLNTVNKYRREAGLPVITQKENRIITKNRISIHEFECAFDVAVTKAGTVIWEIKADVNGNNIPDYEEIGIIGESLGLRWGGRFTFKDYCHFEYTGNLDIADLKDGDRPS